LTRGSLARGREFENVPIEEMFFLIFEQMDSPILVTKSEFFLLGSLAFSGQEKIILETLFFSLKDFQNCTYDGMGLR
jgi:hypothetical protein